MSFPYEDFVQHIQTIKDYVDNKTPELPGSFPVATEVIDVNLSAFDFTRTDTENVEYQIREFDNYTDGLGSWSKLYLEYGRGVLIPSQQTIALSGNRSPILLTLKNEGRIIVEQVNIFTHYEMPIKANDTVVFDFYSSRNSSLPQSVTIKDLSFINSNNIEDTASLTITNDTTNPWSITDNTISVTLEDYSTHSIYTVTATKDGTIKFDANKTGQYTDFTIYHRQPISEIKKICCQYINNTEGGVQYIDKDSGLLIFLSTQRQSSSAINIYLPSNCKYSFYDWTITAYSYTQGMPYEDLASFNIAARWETEISIPLQLPFSAVFVPDLVTGSYIKLNNITFDTKVEAGRITIATVGQLLPKLSGKLYIMQTDKFGKCSIDLSNANYKKISNGPLNDTMLAGLQRSGYKYIVADNEIYKPLGITTGVNYSSTDNTTDVSVVGERFQLSLYNTLNLLGGAATKIKVSELGALPVYTNTRFSHIINYIPLCKISIDIYNDDKSESKATNIELNRDPTTGSFSYAGYEYASGTSNVLKWRYDKVIKENNILYNTESSTYTLTFTKDGTVSFLYQDDYPGGSYHQNSIIISKNGADLVTGYAPTTYTEFSQSVSAGDTILITASKVNAQARFYIKDITFSETDGMTQENNETAPWQVKSESQSFYVLYNNGICYYYNQIEELKDLYIGSAVLVDDTTLAVAIGVYEYPINLEITIPAIIPAVNAINMSDMIDCGVWSYDILEGFAYILVRTNSKITDYERANVGYFPYSIDIKDSDIPDIKVNIPQPLVSTAATTIKDKDYLTSFNEGLIVKPIIGINIPIPPAIKGQFALQLELDWGDKKSSSIMTVSPPMGDRTIEFTDFPIFDVSKPFLEYFKDIGYAITSSGAMSVPLIISDFMRTNMGEMGETSITAYLPLSDKYTNTFITLTNIIEYGDAISLAELVASNPFVLNIGVVSIPSQTDKYTGTLLKDSWHTYTFKGETITDIRGSSATDYANYTQKVAVNDVIDISYNSGGSYGSGERRGYINNLIFTPDDTSKIGTDCMVITNSDTTHPWVVNSDGTITVEIDETNYRTHYNIKFTTPGTVSLQYKCGGYGYISINRTTADVTAWVADIKKAPTTDNDTDNYMNIDNPYYFALCDSELTINYPYEIYMDTLLETDNSYTLRAVYTDETKPDKDMDYELLCKTNTRVYTSQNKVQLKVNNNYNWFADAVTAVFGGQ